MGKKTEAVTKEKTVLEHLGEALEKPALALVKPVEKVPAQRFERVAATLSPHSIQLLQGMLNESLGLELSKNEFGRVVHYAEKHHADPLTGEMWCQVRWSKKKGRDGKDVLVDGKPVYERRLIMGMSKNFVQTRLQAHKDFAGIQSGVVYEKDSFTADLGKGTVNHVVKSIMKHERGQQVAAWCIIERTGKTPYLRILYLSERAQTDWNTGKLMGMWAGMTDTMIQKCVEMDAVRACYPSDFGDVYDQDEMPPQDVKAADFEEVKPLPVPSSSPAPSPEQVPSIPPPAEPAFDVDTLPDGTAGAFVTKDQFAACRALLQEFKLSPAQFCQLIENTFGMKPEALNKLRKPQYAQMALKFGRLRQGEITLNTAEMKFVEPPSEEEAK